MGMAQEDLCWKSLLQEENLQDKVHRVSLFTGVISGMHLYSPVNSSWSPLSTGFFLNWELFLSYVLHLHLPNKKTRMSQMEDKVSDYQSESKHGWDCYK